MALKWDGFIDDLLDGRVEQEPARVAVLLTQVFLGAQAAANLGNVACTEPLRDNPRGGHYIGDLRFDSEARSLGINEDSVTDHLREMGPAAA